MRESHVVSRMMCQRNEWRSGCAKEGGRTRGDAGDDGALDAVLAEEEYLLAAAAVDVRVALLEPHHALPRQRRRQRCMRCFVRMGRAASSEQRTRERDGAPCSLISSCTPSETLTPRFRLRLSRATVSLQPGRSSAWMRASPSASTESLSEIRRSAARISATAWSVSSPGSPAAAARGLGGRDDAVLRGAARYLARCPPARWCLCSQPWPEGQARRRRSAGRSGRAGRHRPPERRRERPRVRRLGCRPWLVGWWRGGESKRSSALL